MATAGRWSNHCSRWILPSRPGPISWCTCADHLSNNTLSLSDCIGRADGTGIQVRGMARTISGSSCSTSKHWRIESSGMKLARARRNSSAVIVLFLSTSNSRKASARNASTFCLASSPAERGKKEKFKSVSKVRKREQTRVHGTRKQKYCARASKARGASQREQKRAHAKTLCACFNLHRGVAGPRSGFVILLETGRRDGRTERSRLCLADVARARIQRRSSERGPPCGREKHRPALQGQEGDRTTQHGRDGGGHCGSDADQRRKASTLILLRVVTTPAEGASWSPPVLGVAAPSSSLSCVVMRKSERKVSCSATYFI